VSGSGKSTVAAILAGQLGWDLQEGDDLHPKTNVDKMAAGIALTDDDRWPWLDRVADWIRDHPWQVSRASSPARRSNGSTATACAGST
jgi:gluconokinase